MLVGTTLLGVIGIIVVLADTAALSTDENDSSAPSGSPQLPSGIFTGILPDPSLFKPLVPGQTSGAVDDELEKSHEHRKSSSSSFSSPSLSSSSSSSSSSPSSSSSSLSSSSSASSSSDSAGDDKDVNIEELPEPDIDVTAPSGQLPKLRPVGVPSPSGEAAVLSASAAAAATSQHAQPVFTESPNVRRKRQDDGGGDAGDGDGGGGAGGGDAGGGDGGGGEDGGEGGGEGAEEGGDKNGEGGNTEPADNGDTGDADGGGKTDGDDQKKPDEQDGDSKGKNAKDGKGSKGKKGGDDEEDGGDNEAASANDGQSETGDGEDEDAESGSDKSDDGKRGGKGHGTSDDDASADNDGGDAKMGNGKGSHRKGKNLRRCQSSSGKLLPTATNCHDTLSAKKCREFKKGSDDLVRNSLCNLKESFDKALKCARTCSICCARGSGSNYSPGAACVDDPNYHGCRRELCHDPLKGAAMRAHCRKTCNLCHSRNNCKDTWVGCEPYKKACNTPSLKSWLARNCAGTCKICGSDDSSQRAMYDCQNRASNCRSLVTLCEDHQWFNVMTLNCARTCGRCEVLKRGGHRDCYDEKAHSCPKWNDPRWPGNNGVPFCNNPAYRDDTRRRYCKKTCGYCF